MALKHTWIQNFNQRGHSASYSYQLLQQIVFFTLIILETKNGIRESDEKQCGIFRPIGAGSDFPPVGRSANGKIQIYGLINSWLFLF